MQSNQLAIKNTKVVNKNIYNYITTLIQERDITFFNNEIFNISITYNIDVKNIIKDYLNYIIRHKQGWVNKKFLNFIEFIAHNPDSNV